MMNLWRATGVALLCLVTLAGAAYATDKCVTKADLLAFLSQQGRPATVQQLNREDARLVLATLAEITKSVAPEADEVLVVDIATDQQTMKLVVFKAGCLDRVGTFQRRAVVRALNALSRSGA